MSSYDKYEAVIGLEVHAQLNTKSKIFAADDTTFGAAPNSQVSPITLGMPGVLPKFNGAVLQKAIKLGLALGCSITEHNYFDRKNYFYADLPKGYQISQDRAPVCRGGSLDLTVHGEKKTVQLNRIHMEEDAGKNNHELDPEYSLIDLNRAGTPLLEIVTEPVIHSADDAYAYLTELRRLLRYLDVCDGNMEEGSMRCDANVSIRLKGENVLNTRVEVKNMNSIRNVKIAIENEFKRQVDLVESGEPVYQETRSFVPADGSSFVLRSKEFAHDYRYFPEPDLPPIHVTPQMIEEVRATMPALPKALQQQFTQNFHLSEYDAQVLTDEQDIALYFLELTKATSNYKAAANWMMGEVKSWLNENHTSITGLLLSPQQLAEIIALVDAGKISSSGAKTLFQAMLKEHGQTAASLAVSLNLLQSSDSGELQAWAEQVIAMYPDKAAEYKKGKKGILGLFMGELMKVSKGKADPKLANKILEDLLKQ